MEVLEQAADEAGDVLADTMSGHTVSVVPQEDDGTAETVSETSNATSKDWRKSDKEWQMMAEAAKKGETAAQQLEKLKEALGLEKSSPKEDVDVVKALTEKIEKLEQETARAKWEKDNPAVDTTENREAWAEIVQKKGHLVKAGELTWDDLWAIVRKERKPTTTARDLKDQELSIGSVPQASKSAATSSDIDPDVYAAMKQAGFSDEQIKMSA